MKRKRNQNETEESSSDDGVEETSFSIEEGGGIELGDTVVLRVPDSAFGDGEMDQTMIARVENIWKENQPGGSGPLLKFRARWFFKKQNVDYLFRQKMSLQLSHETLGRLSPFDLILTSQYDDNVAATICRKVQVIYRRPESDTNLPTLPKGSYVCRYAIAFGDDTKAQDEVQLTPFAGENDNWNEMLMSPRKKIRLFGPSSTKECASSSSSSDSDDSSSIHSTTTRVARVDEGTIEQREIRVGSKHQAIVPDSTTDQSVVSRNPSLVWKAREIPKQSLSLFMEQVAAVLFPYLRENRLTQEEPYSPLEWSEMEAVTKATGSNSLPTLSTMCTSSSLSESSTGMLREFDIDAIMEVLHQKEYDTDAALTTIKASPQDFLTVWSMREKEVFNYSFRKHAGSLRMVLKGISSSKSVQDIVDYHYRFKIPDQFRLFQNKNREQAVRMMESIEARRNINSSISIDDERNSALATSKESGW
jgi:hypothetical protein